MSVSAAVVVVTATLTSSNTIRLLNGSYLMPHSYSLVAVYGHGADNGLERERKERERHDDVSRTGNSFNLA